MRVKQMFVCALLGVWALLAGCGVTPQTPAIAPQGTPNTSPGTQTAGPLPIATDHAAYAPTDVILVTLTNQLALPVAVTDHQASCSIFGIESQSQGVWRDLSAVQPQLARCPLESPTRTFTIASGATYHAALRAGFLRQGDARFPDGAYRLRLDYAPTTNSAHQTVEPATQVVYSATLTVSSSLTPEPLPTEPPPGGGSGTVTSGTALPGKQTTP